MKDSQHKDPAFNDLIDEAIQMELNIGELYLLFYRQFEEDSQFWWQLAIEEENHAALLKTVQQMQDLNVDVPREMFPVGVESLVKSNKEIRASYDDFNTNPDRSKAFQFAFRIENSAGELHYNSFMVHASDSPVGEIFKKLNGLDVDHAVRVRKYMIENQIPFEDQDSK